MDYHGDEVNLLLDQWISFEIKTSKIILTINFKGLAKFEGISSFPISKKGLVNAGNLNQKRSCGSVIP